jgi:hypothetical protein
MQSATAHRTRLVFGVTSVVVLALVLVGTDTGLNALAWVYLQSTSAITNMTHIHAISLDRLDPTCPQCM